MSTPLSDTPCEKDGIGSFFPDHKDCWICDATGAINPCQGGGGKGRVDFL